MRMQQLLQKAGKKYRHLLIDLSYYHLKNDRTMLIGPRIDWDNHMRYFSGMEVARLSGFSVATNDDSNYYNNNGKDKREKGEGGGQKKDNVSTYRKFTFPFECSMKQQWKMLGNSLNVRVAATVAEIGIQSILPELVSR